MSNLQATIGVLLPRSQISPGLGERFLAGLRLALPERAGLRLVSADYGTSQIMAEEQTKRLLGWERVDLLVGLLSVNLAAMLQPLLDERGAICLAANLGENLPRAVERHPLCFQHTLGLWQANWALGRWAAQHLGRRALMAQSFYDSGFDLPYAFQHGFEAAGGEVLHTVVSHVPPDRGSFGPLFARAAELRPDLVFASYCGPAATQFLRAYAEAGLAGRVPLLGSGFLTDTPLLREQAAAALGVRSARGWTDLSAAEPGRAFAAAYQAAEGAPPDAFALLGYECGLLLGQALGASAGDCRPAQLGPALAAAAVDGPRGRLRFEPDTRSSAVEAIYLHEVGERDGAFAPALLARLDPPTEADPRFDELRHGLRSGWVNTYLSI